MKHFFGQVQNTLGVALPNVNVTVFFTGTTTLAPLYSDNGITLTGNPVLSDQDGRFNFYVADGRYDLSYSGPIPPYKEIDREIADILQSFPSDQQWQANSIQQIYTQYINQPVGVTPPFGNVSLYAKLDKHLYYQDDLGNETGPLVAANSSAPQITLKTTNYNTTATDGTILVDATAGPTFIGLVSAVSFIGQTLRIKKIDASANVVNLVPGSGLLDGQALIAIAIRYNSLDVQFDGTNWWIL